MKVLIETMGCPKNRNDSEALSGILERGGHSMTDTFESADAVIINTCGFIEDAKKESISRIFDFINANNSIQSDRKIIIVSGCLSQRYGSELYDEMPEVDIFLGVNDYGRLPEILSSYKSGTRTKYLSSEENDIDPLFRKTEEGMYSATIKISEGCDNHCTYCAIPKIRGRYRSRRSEDILAESEMLAKSGVKELILIAEDTSAYGIDIYGRYALADLIKKLCGIDGIRWIRLMYCYADRINDDLIKVMASEEKVCRYIDIPIQHASDRILRAMGRPSTESELKEIISSLRSAMPDIHIRTTLITGFPGETDEDFDILYKFCEEMRFERLGVFKYSKEEGTPAAGFDDQVDEKVKEERLDALMRLQMDISLEHNRAMIGTVQEVIIDEQDSENIYIGRTEYDAPEIDDQVIVRSGRHLMPGQIVKVLIDDAFDYDLTGIETGEE